VHPAERLLVAGRPATFTRPSWSTGWTVRCALPRAAQSPISLWPLNQQTARWITPAQAVNRPTCLTPRDHRCDDRL